MRATPSQQGPPDPTRKPLGGYQPITAALLAMAWWRYREKLVALADLRVWFAAWEMLARRRPIPDPLPRRFGLDELQALTGMTRRRLEASLRRLDAARLLHWSEAALGFPDPADALPPDDRAAFERFAESFPAPRRRVPVPRRVLRMLAAGARPALVAVVLACLIRCLRFEHGTLIGRGRVKASWIADAFGISPRRVKQARADLVAMGWLIPIQAEQWELNRWGAHVRIDLRWSPPDARSSGRRGATEPTPEDPARGEASARTPVRQESRSGPEAATAPESRAIDPAPARPTAGRSKSSLPPADPAPRSSPPDLNGNPLRGEKNQKPAASGPPGFSHPDPGGGRPKARPTPGAPDLRDVRPEDLADVGRLLTLYDQAVGLGLAAASEFGRLRFAAAAEHARSVGDVNPCGLFASLVRGGLWGYATQTDESSANARLKHHLHGPPTSAPQFQDCFTSGERPRRSPSEDAVLAQAVRSAAVRSGYYGDLFPHVKRQRPDWTRERWNRALAELDGRNPGTYLAART